MSLPVSEGLFHKIKPSEMRACREEMADTGLLWRRKEWAHAGRRDIPGEQGQESLHGLVTPAMSRK